MYYYHALMWYTLIVEKIKHALVCCDYVYVYVLYILHCSWSYYPSIWRPCWWQTRTIPQRCHISCHNSINNVPLLWPKWRHSLCEWHTCTCTGSILLHIISIIMTMKSVAARVVHIMLLWSQCARVPVLDIRIVLYSRTIPSLITLCFITIV